MPWITPNATLVSAAALREARDRAAVLQGGNAYRARVDRIFLQPRYLLLARWADMCAYARTHAVAWPIAATAEEALADFAAAAASHGIVQMMPGLNVSSFVASVDPTQRCEGI